ncbi:hypothetical protein ACFWBI_07880 [Streptomyces sp. NPDC059982]|uniref:hypothetical protein n=1 Tax=unclassified Streptomyces TaxID=2593676 RepID=UPI00369319C6
MFLSIDHGDRPEGVHEEIPKGFPMSLTHSGLGHAAEGHGKQTNSSGVGSLQLAGSTIHDLLLFSLCYLKKAALHPGRHLQPA